jgi:hypothetical protein
MMQVSYVLFVVFLMLIAADGWTTYRILRSGGRELNPVIKWLVERIGLLPALIVTRAVGAGLVWSLVLGGAWYVIAVLDLIFAYTVYNNVMVMRKMGLK